MNSPGPSRNDFAAIYASSFQATNIKEFTSTLKPYQLRLSELPGHPACFLDVGIIEVPLSSLGTFFRATVVPNLRSNGVKIVPRGPDAKPA